ncbi:hypothetical protein O3V59_18680 [Brevibacillus thermoruber]|uniref:Uncharacterized protein n=1 Tax=Brevibacillus thermoruber TaxID=33942 RepID=A0A9X3TSU6_9BACL|nr:hypothetical protein [Brevibacillus thermoruber]MDA5110391.1 hypothetical protein [Brevibacillus thermoruber]
MKNPWKIAFFGLAGVVILGVTAVVLFVNRVGFDNLKLLFTLNQTDSDYLMPMYILKTTDQPIVPVAVTPEGHGIYLTDKRRSPDVLELLKERMNKEGWTYATQMGSGYLFTKDQQKVIVETRIWNSDYVRITVPGNVVTIAD